MENVLKANNFINSSVDSVSKWYLERALSTRTISGVKKQKVMDIRSIKTFLTEWTCKLLLFKSLKWKSGGLVLSELCYPLVCWTVHRERTFLCEKMHKWFFSCRWSLGKEKQPGFFLVVFFFFYNMKHRSSISIAETTEGWISNITAMPNGLSNKLCYDPLCRQPFSAPREGLPSDPIDNQHKGTKPLVCVDDSSRNALNFMLVVYTSLVPTKKHVINMRYRNKSRLPVLPLK